MRVFALATVAVVFAGCTSRELWPVERVDPDTAIHVTVMAEPWIYALADPDQSVKAGEFLYVAVVEANRTGTRSYWLNVVSWRIGDSIGRTEGSTSVPVEARLDLPKSAMRLAPAVRDRSTIGLSERAISVPAETSSEAWFPLSTAQVAELGAGAPSAVALIDEAGRARSYAAWRVNNEAMTEFLKATGTDSN